MSQDNKGAKNISVIAESLYLANLLLLPGISFLALLWLLRQSTAVNNITRIHLYRTIQLTCLAGLFLVVIPLLAIFTMQNYQVSIMISLVYFVTIHALFVLLGMINLTKAMVNKLPIF